MDFCEIDFAHQFLVSNGQMPTIQVKNFSIFRKGISENKKETTKVLCNKTPLDHYDSISNTYISPISLALIKLIKLAKIDDKVNLFSITMLEKFLKSINKLNRVKIERCMIIIRCGIQPICKFSTLEALVELECAINIFYPSDRRFLSENDLFSFSENIYKFVITDHELICKLINEINLNESITKKTREMLLDVIINDHNEIPKLLGCYLNKIEISETPINSVISISETFDIINRRLRELKFKEIKMSSIAISTIVKNSELHIEYFGLLNKPIGGYFILDFNRLNSLLKPNSYTYLIFYFVTCHYCLMNSDNILGVKIKNQIDLPSSNIMFKFLDVALLKKMKNSINKIPDCISYSKIFHCLNLFFNNMINLNNEIFNH